MRKENMRLRAILGVNSSYHHRKRLFRKISKELHVGRKEERDEKKNRVQNTSKGLYHIE